MTFFVTSLCFVLLMLSAEYGDAAVSCDSRLRIPLPHLFAHCNGSSLCAYGPWSEWSYTGVLKNDSRCNSGKVRQHKRARTASTPACESHLPPESEAEYECEPTLNQKAILFIKMLRLGVDAEHSDKVPSTDSPLSRASKNILSRSYRQAPTYGYCPNATQQRNNRVCRNIGCDSSTGKRSVNEESSIVSEFIRIKEYDLEKHIINIREKRKKRRCTNNLRARYVLFIVDTSGSASSTTFNAVKTAIASISELLCDHVKVALMTYGSDINLEFCFNCYNDRRDIKNAILRAQYRGGSTRTTDAIKCACEQILSSQCGLPHGIRTPDIDVVLLTDGYHNGPCRHNLKLTVKCLHARANINTFGIGIGSVDYASVRALTSGVGTNIFRVENFAQLQQLLALIKQLLAVTDANGNPVYSCVGHDGSSCRK